MLHPNPNKKVRVSITGDTVMAMAKVTAISIGYVVMDLIIKTESSTSSTKRCSNWWQFLEKSQILKSLLKKTWIWEVENLSNYTQPRTISVLNNSKIKWTRWEKKNLLHFSIALNKNSMKFWSRILRKASDRSLWSSNKLEKEHILVKTSKEWDKVYVGRSRENQRSRPKSKERSLVKSLLSWKIRR